MVGGIVFTPLVGEDPNLHLSNIKTSTFVSQRDKRGFPTHYY